MSQSDVDDLAAFYDRLSRHDWWHMMSEDYSVVRAGDSELSSLRTIAKTSPDHQSLFDAWNTYIGNRGPKPSRPGGPSLAGTCIEKEVV